MRCNLTEAKLLSVFKMLKNVRIYKRNLNSLLNERQQKPSLVKDCLTSAALLLRLIPQQNSYRYHSSQLFLSDSLSYMYKIVVKWRFPPTSTDIRALHELPLNMKEEAFFFILYSGRKITRKKGTSCRTKRTTQLRCILKSTYGIYYAVSLYVCIKLAAHRLPKQANLPSENT